MAKSKIYRDELGLYANCGSYISRPFFGTKFKVGDAVKTHHFGGSTQAGVTSLDKDTHNFKRSGQYEIWTTTGISYGEYKDKVIKFGLEDLFGSTYQTFDEYLKLNTEWYRKSVQCYASVFLSKNSKFEK